MNKSGDLGFEKYKFQYHKIQVEKKKERKKHFIGSNIISSRVRIPPFLREPPLLSGHTHLSESNLKSYSLFLRAIQVSACKLYETL